MLKSLIARLQELDSKVTYHSGRMQILKELEDAPIEQIIGAMERSHRAPLGQLQTHMTEKEALTIYKASIEANDKAYKLYNVKALQVINSLKSII